LQKIVEQHSDLVTQISQVLLCKKPLHFGNLRRHAVQRIALKDDPGYLLSGNCTTAKLDGGVNNIAWEVIVGP
jgi:hypothetical protein